jgi:hypothetical protein
MLTLAMGSIVGCQKSSDSSPRANVPERTCWRDFQALSSINGDIDSRLETASEILDKCPSPSWLPAVIACPGLLDYYSNDSNPDGGASDTSLGVVAVLIESLPNDIDKSTALALTCRLDDGRQGIISSNEGNLWNKVYRTGRTQPLADLAHRALSVRYQVDLGYDKDDWRILIDESP